MTPYIPILEYHDLNNGYKGGRTIHSPYVLDKNIFEEHLKWLYKHNYQTIAIDDLFSSNIPDNSVILTFDDGHISNFMYALPILKKFHSQATFFLVGEFIGKENYLAIEHIHEMQEQGMKFGSHSMTHPYMLSLNNSTMEYELSESKYLIESIINKNVDHFCVPFGFYNRRLINCINSAGYRSVVTERFGYYHPSMEDFKFLPRFTIKSNITINNFINIMQRNRLQLLSRYLLANALDITKKALGYKGYSRLKSIFIPST